MTAARILVWAALSPGQPLSYANEEIETFHKLQRDKRCTVNVQIDQPSSHIPGLVETFDPDILHFIGHGEADGSVLLNEYGELPKYVRTDDFIQPSQLASRQDRHGPLGIFLSACWSSSRAPHTVPHRGWLVTMQRTVADDAATCFAEEFYDRLLPHIDPNSAATAFNDALAAIRDMGASDEEITTSLWFGPSSAKEPITVNSVGDFLRYTFDRNAFHRSTQREGSLAALRDALGDVETSLATGRVLTREPRLTYLVLDASQHESLKLVCRAIKPPLGRFRKELKTLISYCPQAALFADWACTVAEDDYAWVRTQVHRIDNARNNLIKEANIILAQEGEIELRYAPYSF